MHKPTFVAFDLETADYGRESACAVGIVKVRGTRIVHEAAYLIRPPRQTWGIHPTRLPDVCGRPMLPLDHHDPLSGARACAPIVIQAIEAGVFLESY